MPLMVGPLVVRGLVAGLGAGLAAGVVAFAFAEPLIDAAISHEAAGGDGPVSREGQRAGLFLATGLYGLALGGLFALAFAASRGRVGAGSDTRLAVGLAVALFAAVVLVPFLRYPPAPPGVGDPESISERTLLYLTVVASSLLALLAALRTAHVAGRVAALAVFAVTVASVLFALPPAEAPPASYPDDLVRDFRLASLGVQAVLWLALALLFVRRLPWRS